MNENELRYNLKKLDEWERTWLYYEIIFGNRRCSWVQWDTLWWGLAVLVRRLQYTQIANYGQSSNTATCTQSKGWSYFRHCTMVWVVPFCSPVVELNRWLGTQKLSCADRFFPKQDRSALKSPRIHLHTPPNPTCSRWYEHDLLKVDYKPVPPPPPPAPGGKNVGEEVGGLK